MTRVFWKASLAVAQYGKEGKREIPAGRRDQSKVQAWLCKHLLSLEKNFLCQGAIILSGQWHSHNLILWHYTLPLKDSVHTGSRFPMQEYFKNSSQWGPNDSIALPFRKYIIFQNNDKLPNVSNHI